MEVKALACELPRTHGVPLSRFSHEEIAREAVRQGIVASISGVTVWRWLSADAIRPWTHHSWLWPRDPEFAAKAARILDPYHGMWDDTPLGPAEYVISADEKTSIQARRRKAPRASTWPRSRASLGVRIQARGRIGLPRRLGRAPGKTLRPVPTLERD